MGADAKDLEGFPEELAARFVPLRRLGAGGMGQVVLCRDASLGREVAVKLIGLCEDPSIARRFVAEAEALARVRHPNVVQVYDQGLLATGAPYLVLEYLEGRSLDLHAGDLDVERVLLDVAGALDELHGAGLAHRDVKPGNILWTTEGRAVLLDFGLIRDEDRTVLTRTGQALGTPAYMAPEALRGEPPRPSVDWYGLGATVFELLERVPPYRYDEILELARGRVPRPLEFRHAAADAPLARAAAALLDLDPGARPSNRAALEALLRGEAPRARAGPGGVSGTQAPIDGASGTFGRRVGFAWGVLLAAALAWSLAPGGTRETRALIAHDREEAREGPAPGPAPADPAAVLARAGLASMGTNTEGYRRFRNLRDDSVLIHVPGGPFVSHSRQGEVARGPAFKVQLAPYLIGETSVTVWQWLRFRELDRGREAIELEVQRRVPENPITWIQHHRARDYCRWAGGRLPRAVEYERAGAGLEGRRHPWGEAPPDPGRANYGNKDFGAMFRPDWVLRPVRSYPRGRSPIGAYEMLGNAACWSEDTYPGPDGRAEAIMLGGNYITGPDALTTWLMRTWPVENSGSGIGMRLVREVPPDLAAAIAALPPEAPPAPPGWVARGPNERGYREFDEAKSGARWILVPGGRFVSRASRDPQAPGEPRSVDVAAFLIDRHAVSVGRYARFVQATGTAPPPRFDRQLREPEKPVVHLSWEEAKAYAAWVGARLPRFDEFERAAGGLRSRDYPWGDDPPTPDRANFGKTDFDVILDPIPNLARVDSHLPGQSPVGVLHAAGNAYAWAAEDLPALGGPHLRRPGVLGGSFFSPPEDLHPWYRFTWIPDDRSGVVGVHLVRDVPPGIHALEDPRPPPVSGPSEDPREE